MNWARRYDPWVLGAIALCLRVAVVFWAWGRVPPTADGKFYHVVAQRIAAGEGYTWLWPDGAVTYAAHYPVGYPALMAIPYGIFGPEPGYVMVLNAVLGTTAVIVAYALSFDAVREVHGPAVARVAAGSAGLLLAVSPTLLAYTPALMTEGAVAAFLVFSAGLALVVSRAETARRRVLPGVFMVAALGVAVLLRPQSVLFAPVLGYLSATSGLKGRLFAACLVSLGCLLVVAPWTLRNCDKMERCVFVSANGGWNLLIGTYPEGHGAWVPIDGERVPHQCRDVFQEAAKDECFGRAGRRRIADDFVSWLRLVPAKLRATLDFTAAGADHLAEAGALEPTDKPWVSYPEFSFQRVSFLLALLGAWGCARRTTRPLPATVQSSLLAVGTIGFLGLGAAWGWFALLVFIFWSLRGLKSIGVVVGGFAVFATISVHAVFFGAGRYSLPLLPLLAPLVALGVGCLLERLGYASKADSGGHEV